MRFTRQERWIAWFLISTFLISAGIRTIRILLSSDSSQVQSELTKDDSLFLERVQLVDSLIQTNALPSGHPPAVTGLLEQRAEFQLDINRADAAALQTLPGIGPVMAKRIIAHRVQNGYFKSFSDLQQVKGIGPATIAKLQSHIVFNP